MNKIINIILFLTVSIDIVCGMSKDLHIDAIDEYSICLYDSSRNRIVPVAIYCKNNNSQKGKKVVVFSHGYGQNKGGDYKIYSHINRKLADRNYYVISIQHELPDDELLAMEGNFRITRMPNWERGVKNILFVMEEFKKLKPDLDWNSVSLIGHSNGGDISMLFATKYPQYIVKAVSLDNRRMPLPRASNPEIYSLRACDFPADEGVIPSSEEQKKYNVQVITLDDIKHSEMDDDASESQSAEINNHLLKFLKK